MCKFAPQIGQRHLPGGRLLEEQLQVRMVFTEDRRRYFLGLCFKAANAVEIGLFDEPYRIGLKDFGVLLSNALGCQRLPCCPIGPCWEAA